MEDLEDGPAAPKNGTGTGRDNTRQGSQRSHPSRFSKSKNGPKGTFTNKHDADWVKTDLGALMPVDVLVWRSVTVRFMRALIHPQLAGGSGCTCSIGSKSATRTTSARMASIH